MARGLFSVPIFFIVFRETLEAAIILSVLLGLVEQIVRGTNSQLPVHGEGPNAAEDKVENTPGSEKREDEAAVPELPGTDRTAQDGQLIRKLRMQVGGLLLHLASLSPLTSCRSSWAR